MQTTKAARITCEVEKSLSSRAEAALAPFGIDHAQVHSRRTLVLAERSPLPFLPPTARLEEDPAEVFEIWVPRERARGIVLAWARELQLFTPGRGAIFAEEVEMLSPPGVDFCNRAATAADGAERAGERLSPLSLINCVVQRGLANDLGRRALEAGAHVPSVNFGIGMGVRNRLGLLRVAIPAEKETISLLVDEQDRDETLEILVAAGRLDQPGRGFLAAYPVPFGVGNSKSVRGPQRYSATLDQVISAVDDLKSGTEWRRRSGVDPTVLRRSKNCLTDRVNVTLVCNEGNAEALATAAMGAGAGGATISKARHISPTGRNLATSPGREVIDLAIAPDRLDALVAAFSEARAFGADAAGLLEIKPLPIAFTYLGG